MAVMFLWHCFYTFFFAVDRLILMIFLLNMAMTGTFQCFSSFSIIFLWEKSVHLRQSGPNWIFFSIKQCKGCLKITPWNQVQFQFVHTFLKWTKSHEMEEKHLFFCCSHVRVPEQAWIYKMKQIWKWPFLSLRWQFTVSGPVVSNWPGSNFLI